MDTPIVGGPIDPRPPDEWLPEDGIVWCRAQGKPHQFVRPQCCARSRQEGRTRCMAVPPKGKRTCYFHGGAPGSGGNFKRFRSGLYSNVLGQATRETFDRLLNDEALLDTEPDVALISTRLQQLLERMEQNDSREFRREALTLFERAVAASRANDADALRSSMQALGQKLRTGVETDRAFDQAVALAERRATRAERAREVRAKESEHISRAELDATIALVVNVLLDEDPVGGEDRVGRIMATMKVAGRRPAWEELDQRNGAVDTLDGEPLKES